MMPAVGQNREPQQLHDNYQGISKMKSIAPSLLWLLGRDEAMETQVAMV